MQLHCTVCGQNYEGTIVQYDDDKTRIEPAHACPYRMGTYITYPALEFEYKEGIRYERKVLVTEYSGHKTVEPKTNWKIVEL